MGREEEEEDGGDQSPGRVPTGPTALRSVSNNKPVQEYRKLTGPAHTVGIITRDDEPVADLVCLNICIRQSSVYRE